MSKLTRYNTIMGLMCNAAEVERLEALNAELLEALEKVAELFDNDMVERLFFINKAKAYHLAMAVDQARAAIAKAKGEVMP